jgi:hypothetical protein
MLVCRRSYAVPGRYGPDATWPHYSRCSSLHQLLAVAVAAGCHREDGSMTFYPWLLQRLFVAQSDLQLARLVLFGSTILQAQACHGCHRNPESPFAW